MKEEIEMKITICDCCKEEIQKNRRVYNFSYLCHLDKELRNKAGFIQFPERERFSGRYEEKDLCLKCYNKIMIKAVLEFEHIEKETGK